MSLDNIKTKVAVVKESMVMILEFVSNFNSGLIVHDAEEFSNRYNLDVQKVAGLIVDLLIKDERNSQVIAERFIEEIVAKEPSCIQDTTLN